MQKVFSWSQFCPDLRNWTFLDQLKSKKFFFCYFFNVMKRRYIRSLIYTELRVASYSWKIHKYIPILESKDQNWEYVLEHKICEFAKLCHEYEVLDLFSCGLVKPQVVTTTTTIKPKPENDQKGEFCFLFICITL